MSSNTATTQQEDFPVGYAQHHPTSDENTVFYVEWLDNSSEFPSLSSTNEPNFTGGTWELLRRKEMNEEEHTLVSVEDDAWSKLTTSNELYVDIAEKNADLKPTKRTIQPLWSNLQVTKKTVKEEPEQEEEDLGYELLINQKMQSRRANRLANRRLKHDLKTVDIHVEGILRLATTRIGKTNITWVPYENNNSFSPEKLIVDEYFDGFSDLGISNKPDALRYASRFNHNLKRYVYKYGVSQASKRPILPEDTEFSVHSNIVTR